MMSDQQKHADAVHKRLMGKQPEPRPMKLAPPDPDVEAVVTLPTPTKTELDAILNDDEVVWRDGVKLILKAYGENMRRLTSLQRDSHIMKCRFDVASYLRKQHGWSYPRIGEFMHRDHSSILALISPDYKRSAVRLAAREAKSK